MNEAVLQGIEAHALTPEAIEGVIQLCERKDIAKRIARLVAAIETGGDAASLVAKVRDLKALKVEAARFHPIPRLEPSVIGNRPSGGDSFGRQRPNPAPFSSGCYVGG